MNKPLVFCRNRFAGRTNLQNLGNYLRQRNKTIHLPCRCWFERIVTVSVSEFANSVQNPYGHRFSADRADAVEFFGFFRCKAHITFSVSVFMVFAFFRKKFNGSDVSVSCFQSVHNTVKIRSCVKYSRFSCKFCRRMSIRIRHKSEFVKF